MAFRSVDSGAAEFCREMQLEKTMANIKKKPQFAKIRRQITSI